MGRTARNRAAWSRVLEDIELSGKHLGKARRNASREQWLAARTGLAVRGPVVGSE